MAVPRAAISWAVLLVAVEAAVPVWMAKMIAIAQTATAATMTARRPTMGEIIRTGAGRATRGGVGSSDGDGGGWPLAASRKKQRELVMVGVGGWRMGPCWFATPRSAWYRDGR